QQRTAALADANAKLVEQMAERQSAEEARRDSEQRLQLALQASRTGTWDWDLATGCIVWDKTTHTVFGVAPGGFPGSYEAFESRVHPDDRASVQESIERAIAQRTL